MNTNFRQLTRWPQRLLEHRAYSEYLWAYLFLLPFLLIFGAFTVYTLAWGVVISFQDYTAFRAEHRFNGFDNYLRALRDPVLWHSLRVSALYTIATVPVGILWPFFLAVIIQQLHPRLRAFYRSAFYLPGVTSGVVMTLVWVWIFYPMAGGLANGLLSLFGIKPQLWFGDAKQALPSLIFMSWLTGWGGGRPQRGVLFVHRFGATLNAHVHLHLCMLDGVVAQGRQGLAAGVVARCRLSADNWCFGLAPPARA